MRKHLISLILIVGSIQSFAQLIETDIFDNFIYESPDGFYKSYLKKNIFDDLVFSDNKGNVITLKNEYIKMECAELLKNKEIQLDYFRDLVHEYRHERDYKATYSVDVLGKIIFEDNRDRKVEIGEDIFGNTTYREEADGEFNSMKRNLDGSLELKTNNENAILKRDIFNNWIYKDSSGNEFKFSSITWDRLKDKFETEENIFYYLIYEFLYI